ncbi:hypothetical protein GGD41_000629 [Paraburkholderia bryophila]|uniref:DNA topoisomerase (ATP-hydrolyzing) n=1 Tax=Paraburkholderia bryophila TaxID=420952 RepID=A0A7Z0AXB5_9BURK|nr:hypothetical protein [Paraburkholderia bryophila]
MDQFAKETLPISLEEEMRRSYLDYAMSVIVGRALPDVRDGLKPVHRRVLYAMHELNNDWNRAYKKSARIVGDVIGKYHPHGDTAVYDTIVRMAQHFSLRYMLVDGQGNFGSVDGDNAAAMRYTEIRMAKIGHELLADIDKETVDFTPNYDGSENEPAILPARIPNLLINGSSGIAVGMATNIPPHNLNEVVDACQHLLKNPEATIDELIEIIPAPDFPTAGIIYGVAGVRDGYRTGRGRVLMRALTHFEEIDRGQRMSIIVDELPYQVNKRSLLERIAELVNEKKLEGISDIRDESDKSGMRVVIELKRGEVPEVVLNNLYKATQLQDTFGMNMVALVDGQPKLLNLKEMLSCFLSHRREVLTRRTVYELRKARERGHVLEGLAVALANIDEFIALIKGAPTPPIAKQELMARPWDSSLVREMLSRAESENASAGGREAYRPDGLNPAFGMQSDGPLPSVRHSGSGNSADASAAPDGSRAGQDHRRVSRSDGANRRPAGHSGSPGTHYGDHRRRTDVDQSRIWRRAPLEDRDERDRAEHGRPDHAAGNGRDHVACRLCEVAAAVRIQRAEAWWPRQAGHGHERRRLDRHAVHREHARPHSVLLESRSRLQREGLRSAARFAELARPSDREYFPAAGRRKDYGCLAGQGILGRQIRIHGHRVRNGKKDAAGSLWPRAAQRYYCGRSG